MWKLWPSEKTMGKTERKKCFSDNREKKETSSQTNNRKIILNPPPSSTAYTQRQAGIKIKTNYFHETRPHSFYHQDNAPKNMCAMLHTFTAMDIKRKPSLEEVIGSMVRNSLFLFYIFYITVHFFQQTQRALVHLCQIHISLNYYIYTHTK